MVELENMQRIQKFRNQNGWSVFRGKITQGEVLGLSHDVVCMVNGLKRILVEVIPLDHGNPLEALVITRERGVCDYPGEGT